MGHNNLLEQRADNYSKYYKTYKAAYCRTTGLPLYNHDTAEQMVADGLYSKTRAAKEKVDIDDTDVCGWYRTYNGYVPLFRKKESN
ncbi:MAG: hypothetical protein IJO29_01500 [Oscillospiraceae bacterium]|nr:hypothetical protein [Oscillospiraceae bacterium]